jgi:regulator of sirC expression with transglutaminase-like and TPR domain
MAADDEAEIARLRALLDPADERIDLAEAALALAALADPALDPRPSLHALDALAAGLRDRLGPDGRADAAALGHYLGHACGFTGNLEQYYDPANSYLNVVLERRVGLPITLSVIYMEVGRRVGLTVHGIGFPAHFIVGVPEGGRMRYLDPFRAGRELTRDDLAAQLRQTYGRSVRVDARMLQPIGKRAIIIRMLNNLKQAYLRQEALELALRANERLAALQPGHAEHERDRAVLLYQLSAWRPAKAALAAYLGRHPSGPDALALRGLLATVETILATQN